MSTLEVNTITPQSGTTLTLGSSGDTINLGSGASGLATTNGITMADQWIVTSSFTGDVDPISSNLARVTTVPSLGVVGSAMSVSSGYWTFPSTGIYYVAFSASGYGNVGDGRCDLRIGVTTDNSSYTNRAITQVGPFYYNGTQTQYSSGTCHCIVDVTDTSLVKVKFAAYQTNNSNQLLAQNDATTTNFTFIRLGDT